MALCQGPASWGCQPACAWRGAKGDPTGVLPFGDEVLGERWINCIAEKQSPLLNKSNQARYARCWQRGLFLGFRGVQAGSNAEYVFNVRCSVNTEMLQVKRRMDLAPGGSRSADTLSHLPGHTTKQTGHRAWASGHPSHSCLYRGIHGHLCGGVSAPWSAHTVSYGLTVSHSCSGPGRLH